MTILLKTGRARLSPAMAALGYAALAAPIVIGGNRFLEDRQALAGGSDENFVFNVVLPLLFVSVTAAIMFVLARHAARNGGTAGKAADGSVVVPPTPTWRKVLIFLVLTAIPPLGGIAVVVVHSVQTEESDADDMQAIARLKAGQIEQWLLERHGDARTFQEVNSFASRVEQFINAPAEPQNIVSVMDRMAATRSAYNYLTIMLVDAGGRMVLAAGDETDVPPQVSALLPEAISSGLIGRTDIYLGPSGGARMDWVAPIRPAGRTGDRAIAAIVLRVAPEAFLFPLIQKWPTQSPTAESLLVRRDGSDIVFLNTLRHRGDHPLSLRLPLASPTLVAAIAMRAGAAGVVTSGDYRGVEVVGAYLPVAGTNWFLISKIDRDEQLVPLLRLVFWVSLVAAAAAATIVGMVTLLWRQQRLAYVFQAKAESARADLLLNQFFNLPFIGMAMSRPDSKKLARFNDRVCTMLGYTRQELAELDWTSITHPDDLPGELAQVERIMRGEIDSYEIEKRFIAKDGRIVPTETEIRCVRRADGTVEYFLGTFDDITERKRAQQALHESEVRYRRFIENASDLIYGVDPRGHITFVSPNWAEVIGEPADAPIGKPLEAYVHPDDATACRIALREALTVKGHLPDLEFRVRRANGEIRWFVVRGSLLRNENGAIYGLMGIGRDITEQRKIQVALRESELRYRSLFAESNSVMLLIDPQEGAIVDANAAAAAFYGWSVDALKQMNIKDINTASPGEVQAEIERSRDAKNQHFGFRHRLANGEIREVEVFSGPVGIGGRKVLLSVIHDITEQKRAQEQVRTYIEQLNTSLMQTVEVATALSEMRDPYTAGHERRVAMIAVAIAGEMGLPKHDIEGLRVAGYLHDIGKIGLPAEILVKPGRLTQIEYSLVKAHPQTGYDAVKNVDFPWPVADMVLQHHERLDGSGYPNGLRGDAILPGARILGVADVVEAMASHRPYRPALGIEPALAEIEAGRGTRYDAAVVDACVRLFRDKGYVLPAN